MSPHVSDRFRALSDAFSQLNPFLLQVLIQKSMELHMVFLEFLFLMISENSIYPRIEVFHAGDCTWMEESDLEEVGQLSVV